MTDNMMQIIAEAVRIRVRNGENIDDVLAGYKKLTDEEKQEIKKRM